MPKPHSYKDALAKVKKRLPDISVKPGKGSHQKWIHPDIHGQKRMFPVPNNRELDTGYLKGIIRRFDLPDDFFD